MPPAGDAPGPAPAPAPVPKPTRTTYADVFAVPEFRALWFAQILSVAGDQLARVALTVLVFNQTSSVLLAAVTFAASVFPAFIGGITLASLADRLPRRGLMIVCDLSRAALVAVMAVPHVPVAVLISLLVAVTIISSPFTSARAALYPDILTGDRYVLGTAVTMTSLQFAQVLGFAVGGAVVSFLGVSTSLVVDALTFVASALIVRLLVKARPVAQAKTARPGPGGLLLGVRLVLSTPALRTPVLFAWLAAFYNVPEGVAVPLGYSFGARMVSGAVAAGLLLAARALGSSVGAILFGRLVAPERRARWMSPFSMLASAVLVIFVIRPPLLVALAILVISGLFDSYQLAANASFVRAAPAEHRASAFGVAQGGLLLGEGAAMILAGALALHYQVADVVAVSGIAGTLCGALVAVTASRFSGSSGSART